MTAIPKIVPRPGGTPLPSEVLGRDDLIIELCKELRGGTNFILSDPRRMGKTALLIRLCNEPGDDITAVHMSLEGIDTLKDAIETMLSELLKHAGLKKRISKTLEQWLDKAQLDLGYASLEASPPDSRMPLVALEKVIIAVDDSLNEGELLVVAVDEVTRVLDNLCKNDPHQASLLLQVLNRLRSRTKSRVRWILTGSVGFHHVIRQAGETEGIMANAETLDLGPLTFTGATRLAASFFAGIEREADDDVIEAIVNRTDGIPFFMQHITKALRGSDDPVTVDEAEAAWIDFINDRSKSAPSTHLVTRLDPYYDDPKLVKEILDHFALSTEPVTFEEMVATFSSDAIDRDGLVVLVDSLVDDHYLDGSGEGWRYQSLREIWIARRRLA